MIVMKISFKSKKKLFRSIYILCLLHKIQKGFENWMKFLIFSYARQKGVSREIIRTFSVE
jgi:hypothetical protein